MKNNKPDFTDGLHTAKTLFNYRESTRFGWRLFPEILAVYHTVIFLEPVEKGIMPKLRAIKKIINESVSFLLSVSKPVSNIPNCDAILFYSSDKPSIQPATNILASRLAEKGLRCAVIFSEKQMSLWSKEDTSSLDVKTDNVNEYRNWMYHGTSRFQNWRLLCRSFVLVAVLLLLLARRGEGKLVSANPYNVWYQLLLSSLRLEACNSIVNHLKPKFLIVNNEHVPVAAELVLLKSGKIRKIQFLNEMTANGIVPIYSKEVWVWNQTMIDYIMKINNGFPKPAFHIIGCAELTFALIQPEIRQESENNLKQSIGAKPVFLFLMDYAPSKVINTFMIAAEANRWISRVAAACPNWHFIIKTRPYHHTVDMPGIEFIENQKNITISRGEIGYREFLGWDNILAVGSCSSTGLYVAAGTGRIACRFLISSAQSSLPLIDEVTAPIHLPEELVKLLHNIEKEGRLKHSIFTSESEFNKKFPYRGQTIDRMESLCLL